MSPPPKGTLKLRPAIHPTDTPTIGFIGRAAFGYSSRILFPNADPDDIESQQDEIRWRCSRFVLRFQDGNPASVAVDVTKTVNDNGEEVETEKVVGIAQWRPPKGDGRFTPLVPGQGGSGDGVNGDGVRDVEKEEKPYPPSMNIAKYDELMSILLENETRIMGEQGLGEEDIWYLLTLAASPDQKRRGIGKMLLRWGIEQAVADKKHIFLTATAEGRFLYASQGFEVVGEYVVGGEPHYAMILRYQDGEGLKEAQVGVVNGNQE